MPIRRWHGWCAVCKACKKFLPDDYNVGLGDVQLTATKSELKYLLEVHRFRTIEDAITAACGCQREKGKTP